MDALRRMEFGSDSQINIPIAVLIRLMISPMLLKVDFTSILGVGMEWFEKFLRIPHPVTVIALLVTLVCIFAFQADNITARSFHILLIAVPILVQVYLNSSLAHGLMKWLQVPHAPLVPRGNGRLIRFDKGGSSCSRTC